jgi:hypothetical protein
MSAYFTHGLEMNQVETITHSPSADLSIVDLDSYQTFVGQEADNLDLMVHLQDQLSALTAFTWDVPDKKLNLKFIVTGDHKAMERVTFSNRPPSASGTVRTHGNLCLVGHNRLLACARHRTHTILKGGHHARGEHPHVLKVPPGIYYILAYYHYPYPDGNYSDYLSRMDRERDYTIYLHHYPHAAPRVAPVRLTGGLIPWAGKEAPGRPWGGMHGAQ